MSMSAIMTALISRMLLTIDLSQYFPILTQKKGQPISGQPQAWERALNLSCEELN